MSKFVEKFRKTKNYKEDYGYDYDVYKEKKKSKTERTQLKRLRTDEYSDYAYDNMKRTR